MKKPGQRVVMMATALAVCWYSSNNSVHSSRAAIEVASANAFPAKVTAMEKKMRKASVGRPANVSSVRKCVHCQEEFRGQKRLQKHLWDEHERATRWHCGDCDCFLSSKQKLDEHMQTQRHKSNLATNGFMEVQEQGKAVKKDTKGEEERPG